MPTILTTVAEKSFSGPMYEEIKSAFPGQALIDRTTMNTWEDANVIEHVNRIGRPRVVLAGLWTSVCIVGPALSALDQGFEVYVVADACGDVSDEAHERAMQRMTQAGARPMTSLQYLLELQRDWGTHRNLRADDRDREEVRRRVRSRHHLREDDVRRARRLMKVYLASLAAGLLVGVIYGLINVRSPAPPVIALIGLLGILAGEQIPPLAKSLWARQPAAVSWLEQIKPHMFGHLPKANAARTNVRTTTARRMSADPELILHGGRCTTLDRARPSASAVAITQGRFSAVGDDAEVLALAARRRAGSICRGAACCPA